MATRTITRLYDTRDAAERAIHDLQAAGIPQDRISLLARHGDDAVAGTPPGSADPMLSGASLAGTGPLAPGGVYPTPGMDPLGGPGLGTGPLAARDPAFATTTTPVGSPGLASGPLAGRDPAYVPESAEPATATGAGASIGTIIGGGAGLLAGIGALAIPGVGPVIAAGWLVATITGAGIGAAGGGLLGSLTGAGHTDEEAHGYSEGVRRGGTLVSVRAEENEVATVEEVLHRHDPVDLQERVVEYRASGWNRFDESDTGERVSERDASGRPLR